MVNKEKVMSIMYNSWKVFPGVLNIIISLKKIFFSLSLTKYETKSCAIISYLLGWQWMYRKSGRSMWTRDKPQDSCGLLSWARTLFRCKKSLLWIRKFCRPMNKVAIIITQLQSATGKIPRYLYSQNTYIT